MATSRPAPHFQLIDGVPRSPLLDPDTVRAALKHRPRDGDVVLITYPKSGSHWTLQIIQLILNRGESTSNFAELVKRTPSLEAQGLKSLEDLQPPRVARTHFDLLRHNFNEKAKYIYVARSPWDVCVSFYHVAKCVPGFRFQNGTLDDFFETFLNTNFGFGHYFDHVLSGHSFKDYTNVLFLTFEELKAEKPPAVLKIAYFLGEEHGKMLEDDREIFDRVLRKSTIEYMRGAFDVDAKAFTAVFTNVREVNADDTSATKPTGVDNAPKLELFRKGRANDWKEVLTKEQMERLRDKVAALPQASIIISLWKELKKQDNKKVEEQNRERISD
ncbi:sulfotransferase ssu-1 [Ixodes scapularis]